jgi:Na+-translocating ferredoxin:NAD+ oxidoreductase RnfG subunit
MTTRDLVIATITAISGCLAAVIYSLANRSKTTAEAVKMKAEAVDLIANSAVDLMERAVKHASETEAKLMNEVRRLESKVDELTNIVRLLVGQLKDHDVEPNLPADYRGL